MLVKWVEADSVEVLMVELHDEFMVITLGVAAEVLLPGELFVIRLVLAVLKYSRRRAVPVGTFVMMESVSELLEAYGLVGRAMCIVAIVFAMELMILGGCAGAAVSETERNKRHKRR